MRTYTVREVADAVGVAVSISQHWDRMGRLQLHRSPKRLMQTDPERIRR
jgi:predicted site-specific integrase-resolvase